MNHFSELIDYFENIAIKHVDLLHSPVNKAFARLNVSDVLSNLPDLANRFLTLEDIDDYSMEDFKSDNQRWNIPVYFMVLVRIADVNSIDEQESGWQQSESIGEDIIRRIFFDKLNYTVRAVADLKVDTIKGMRIISVNSYVGVRYSMSLIQNFDININPDKWTDQYGN